MRNSMSLFTILIIVMFLRHQAVVASLSPEMQKLALFQFKLSLKVDQSASEYCDSSRPKTKNWSMTSDCCTWDGVTCEHNTGDIIGLDLSCSQLEGAILPNSTLFHLSRLQSLNLAYNYFSLSNHFPQNFGFFAPGLMHLNLSNTFFSEGNASGISNLYKLVSLDLSDSGLKLEHQLLELLLQNLTHLRILDLRGVDISSVLPMNLSTSLTHLILAYTGLHGVIPEEVFHLPNLEVLDLSYNFDLTGNLPKVKWGSSSTLQTLDLGSTGLSGEVPDSIADLKSLTSLSLSGCSFSGPITASIANLTLLTRLILPGNYFSGPIPNVLANLTNLTSLDLSYNDFQLEHHSLELLLQNLTHLRILDLEFVDISSVLPMNLSTSLTHLNLAATRLHGVIPEEVFHLPNLEVLDLSFNFDLTGNLPKVKWGSSSTLQMLDLGSTGLSGEIPNSIADLKSLTSLSLSGCSFSGPITASIANLTNLTSLDLRGNNLSGPFPSWVVNLRQLRYLILSNNSLTGPLPSNLTALCLSELHLLDLSENSLNGTIPSWLFDLPSLTRLALDSNRFTGKLNEFTYFNSKLRGISFSDNLLYGTIPQSFSHLVNLTLLDLSSNNFSGVLDIDMFLSLDYLESLYLSHNSLIDGEIPHWIGEIRLSYLNLSHNNLTGGFENLPWNSLAYLDLQHNMLNGSLPASICKAYLLSVLNLSHNKLSGVLPTCTENLTSLAVFDLRMNNIQGHLPSTLSNFRQLQSLNLHSNNLEGTIPPSFAEFDRLEVLDLGSNQINDTFPQHLEALPNLQVLVLKSNHLHGPISNNSEIGHPFPSLRIVDLSCNDFSGPLPARYIKNFKAMMNGTDVNKIEGLYMGDYFYSDSTTMVIKGVETEFVRILTILTAIDLSKNKFEGEIPEYIGNLVLLRYLNLSHNHLTGHIPSSIRKLSVLESLDLSFNGLEGEIPQELTSMTFLSHLNLSENKLRGRIPQGNEFNTYENDSYIGNLGLCGRPLSKECDRDNTEGGEDAEEGEDDESGFTWEAVVIGYGSGAVIGFSMGCLMFLVGKPKWFVGIIARELGLKVRRLEIRTRW